MPTFGTTGTFGAKPLNGRRERILQRRKEVQTKTIERRRAYNRALRELTKHPPPA